MTSLELILSGRESSAVFKKDIFIMLNFSNIQEIIILFITETIIIFRFVDMIRRGEIKMLFLITRMCIRS